MTRWLFFVCCALSITAWLGTSVARNITENQDSELQELKEERIQLLEKRIEVAQEWIESGRAGRSILWEPQLDVLTAKLEYADSNTQQRELYKKMLPIYDQMIEQKEFADEQPPISRVGHDSWKEHMHTQSEVLRLRAERVRIQILLSELETSD